MPPPATLSRYLPILHWLPRYRKEWLGPDVIAGLTTAAVVIPKAMAYANVAGLYVAFMPMLLYALLGTSGILSVSSTSTLAILTAGQLALVAPGRSAGEMMAAAAVLALLTGLFLFLARVLRLGFLANFISEPVLAGFKGGIGLVIIADQVPKLLGLHIDKNGFFRDLFSVLQHLPESSRLTVALAAAMLLILFLLDSKVFTVKGPCMRYILF